MTFPIPEGFSYQGVHSGVKRNPNKPDLALFVSDRPCTAAGVYTTNRVVAAPVVFDRSRTPSTSIRAVVANSGNANACTGERGDRDCATMAQLAADALGLKQEEMLVLSTGIIGEFLPLEKIGKGIAMAAPGLGREEENVVLAARGLLTTDTIPKLIARQLEFGGRTIRLLGFCKGAAMIGPNMATMLGILTTDAKLEPDDAQRLMRMAADSTFNCLSIDGHVSTNDTVLLLANGAAGGESLKGEDLETFGKMLVEVSTELVRLIAQDGEGTEHIVTIDVEGTASVADARQIARTIANSPLVKTAIHGADPNWGRIVSAAGYAGIEFDPRAVSLWVQNVLLYEKGTPQPFDGPAVSQLIKDNRDTHMRLVVGSGPSKARFWTTDLTAEYVRLNAEYHT